MLFSGVGVALIAVICGGFATWMKDRYRKRHPVSTTLFRPQSMKKVPTELALPERKKKKKPEENGKDVEKGSATSPQENGKPNEKSSEGTSKAENGNAKENGSGPTSQEELIDIKEAPPNRSLSIKRGLIFCIISGCLYAGWSGFGVLALRGGHYKDTPQQTSLSPYGTLFYFQLGVFFTSFPMALIFLRYPVDGSSSINPWKEYISLFWYERLSLFAAGAICTPVFASNFAAGDAASFAVSFAILNSSPLVAALWGMCLYKDMANTDCKTKFFFILMIVLFVSSIGLVVGSTYI